MKNKFYIIAFAICLVACKKEIKPQNPDFKLSQEHGKMLNLIVNLVAVYGDHNIGFDTSSDNYVTYVYYDDFDSKSVKSISLYNLKYCDGIITDINSYRYNHGTTYHYSKFDTHIRWDKSSITVTKFDTSAKYYLYEKNALKTSSKYWTVAPAAEIRKIDDNNYFYRQKAPGKYDSLFATAYDGDNIIEFDTLEGEKKVFDIIRIWTADERNVCRFYLDGWIKQDNQYSKGYFFENTDLKKGYYYYFDDEKEIHDDVTREYDDAGRLIYEEKIYENGKATVSIYSKTIPDVASLSPSLTKQIDLENAIDMEE